MVSYKTLFFVKCMTIWNWSTEKVKSICSKAYSLYDHVSVYFHRDFYTWYLFENSLFPLSYRQQFHMILDATWKYRPDKQTMTWIDSSHSDIELNLKEYRIAWLSASVSSSKRESDMDSFLSSLCIYTPHDITHLPINILMQAWSIYDREWWIHSISNKIKWIDEFAEEHEQPLHETGLVPVARTPSSSSQKKIET